MRPSESGARPGGRGGILIGSSAAMRAIRARLDKLAPHDVSVGLTGETGVGKGQAARYLHARSGRTGAFATLNCGAIPQGLFEGEVFGYRSGAFTDAKHAKTSPLVAAHRGTVLLDEWTQMPAIQQAKLLTTFDERQVTPLGGGRPVPFDVRIVSATNRDLHEAMEVGELREDFYYRVMEVPIRIPPLRERPEDIGDLAEYFLGGPGPGAISPEAMGILVACHWPGNVRQLLTAMRVAAAVANGGTILAEHLPPHVLTSPAARRPPGLAPFDVRYARFEHVRSVLDRVEWHQAEAARLLGVRRKTLREWARKWVVLGWLSAEEVRWGEDPHGGGGSERPAS